MHERERLDRLYTAFAEALPADRARILAGVAGVLLRPAAGGGAVPAPRLTC